MLQIPNDRLPLAASFRLSPDNHGDGRHIVLIKPDNRRIPFAGVTRMLVGSEGLTPERVAAINRALAAEFLVTLICADADSACDTYLDVSDLLTASRLAARAERATPATAGAA